MGLTCDNLISADVVTADGQLLTANANENPDLFWGLRGGGGNFGVVTSFEYSLHPVGTLLAGFLIYPLTSAKQVLHFYREYKEQAPDDLRVDAAFITTPDGTLVVSLVPCYMGPREDGERILRPLRAFGPPAADMVGAMSYCQLQAMLDPVAPPDHLNYWKSSFVAELSDTAIETMIRYAEARPSPTAFLFLEDMHGAASRVRPDDTAFAHRQAHYTLLIVASWTEAADSEKHIRWVRDCWEAMQLFTAGSVYVNYLGEEGEQRVRAAYGPNYERLVALKNKYDPTNFFRLNQNIRPKG
jgi:Berberine and berberine like